MQSGKRIRIVGRNLAFPRGIGKIGAFNTVFPCSLGFAHLPDCVSSPRCRPGWIGYSGGEGGALLSPLGGLAVHAESILGMSCSDESHFATPQRAGRVLSGGTRGQSAGDFLNSHFGVRRSVAASRCS